MHTSINTKVDGIGINRINEWVTVVCVDNIDYKFEHMESVSVVFSAPGRVVVTITCNEETDDD